MVPYYATHRNPIAAARKKINNAYVPSTLSLFTERCKPLASILNNCKMSIEIAGCKLLTRHTKGVIQKKIFIHFVFPSLFLSCRMYFVSILQFRCWSFILLLKKKCRMSSSESNSYFTLVFSSFELRDIL